MSVWWKTDFRINYKGYEEFVQEVKIYIAPIEDVDVYEQRILDILN